MIRRSQDFPRRSDPGSDLRRVLELEPRRDEPLRDRTSFRIGGHASQLVEPTDLDSLVRCVRGAREVGVPVLTLGGGTNLLLPDGGFEGLVISTAHFTDDEIPDDGEFRLRVRPGTPLKRVIHAGLKRGWAGLEYFVGIPGTIGGAVYGNAGSRGYGIKDYVERLLLVDRDGETHSIRGDELPWEYRYSGIGSSLVAEIVLRLGPGDRREMGGRARDLFNLKRDTQPLQAASAGCVFRNPPGQYAGQLIENAGLKGMAVGDARVSDQHANFIVNEGTASARDVHQLVERVRTVVRQKFDVWLQREIITPGSDGVALRESADQRTEHQE